MPRMTIIRSIEIQRSVDEVFPLVFDFHNWIKWSPWHVLDDENNYQVSQEGAFYSWDSKLLGSGQMQRLSAVRNERVESDLLFLKPWKSKSRIVFSARPMTETSCQITWEMHGKMPFFMFFFIKAMERMVGMDFHRGLLLLKDVAEHGSNRCSLKVIGEEELKENQFIGMNFQCSFDDMGMLNQNGFDRLIQFVESEQLEVNGPPATLYQEFNLMKNRVKFTVAIPVLGAPKKLPTGMVVGSFKGGKYFAIELKGPYHHLGSAWSAITMRERTKVFKSDKSRPAVEVYLNAPSHIKEEELITMIYSPVK